MRRSEIMEITEIRLTAHETALERIVRKTQEMASLERRLSDGEDEHAQTLLEAVNNSVSPSSESSVVCYRELLPAKHRRLPDDVDEDEEVDDDDDEDESEVEEPELDPQDSAIKMALLDHALVIKRCLAMFSRSNIEILTRRHEELQQGTSTECLPKN
jgi:hypothetical protein